MRLDALTLQDCEKVRIWRNQTPEVWRTPYLLTAEQQKDFYENVVCNRNSPHRYWAILGGSPVGGIEPIRSSPPISWKVLPEWIFIGMGGLTYIGWENRIAEISLIMDPDLRGQGLGEQAVDLLLDQGFDRLGLKTICGEVYGCNENGMSFWTEVITKYDQKDAGDSDVVILPNRKFWAGKFWNSLYISIDCDDWRRVHGA